jgi:hypothetical protein
MRNLERTLLTILRHHLDAREIGADDDFYALGGDSIVALRVVADATSSGIPIELRDVLFHPTARGLAAVAADRAQPATTAAASHEPFDLLDPYDRALVPAGVRDAWPASALQVGLIYLAAAARDPSLYQDRIGLELTGTFDEARFAAALAELCQRHDALQSSFDLGSFTEPVQLVWSAVQSPLTVERATSPDAVVRMRAARQTESMDLTCAPALHCHVVALPGSCHVMLTIHHAIIDGWSLARLVLELVVLYQSALAGRPAHLPVPPAGGYQEFLALERAAGQDGAAADFWQAEVDVPPLLFDRGRFAGPTDPTGTVTFDVDPPMLIRLRAAARRIGVPLKSLALGCHAAALARWTGRDRDVVLGLTVNGRPERPGADLLVGLFLNSVPVRLSTVTGDLTAMGRAALAAEQRILPHRRFPLARIEQRLGRAAFDVLFNFTHFHVYRELAQLDGLRAGSWWSFDKTSFPMLVDFMIDARGFGTGVKVAYDPAMLAPARIEDYARHYREALCAAAGDGR